MKKELIKIGGTYFMKVSGSVVPVRVDDIRETSRGYPPKLRITYECTNLKTGRKCKAASAQKFRGPVDPFAPIARTAVRTPTTPPANTTVGTAAAPSHGDSEPPTSPASESAPSAASSEVCQCGRKTYMDVTDASRERYEDEDDHPHCPTCEMPAVDCECKEPTLHFADRPTTNGTLTIERETDADGVRFYWMLDKNGEVFAGSAKHFSEAEIAEGDGREEAAMLNVRVDRVVELSLPRATADKSDKIRAARRNRNGTTTPMYGRPTMDGGFIDDDGFRHEPGSWFASQPAQLDVEEPTVPFADRSNPSEASTSGSSSSSTSKDE